MGGDNYQYDAERENLERPTKPGFYWFTGSYLYAGKWALVRVFRPLWVDPSRHDLEWSYLDGSGSYPLTGGEWSPQVLPPDMPNDQDKVALLLSRKELELIINAMGWAPLQHPQRDAANEMKYDLKQLRSEAFPPNTEMRNHQP